MFYFARTEQKRIFGSAKMETIKLKKAFDYLKVTKARIHEQLALAILINLELRLARFDQNSQVLIKWS